jgi:O-antigen/teichoic acid export membrane protein
LPKNLFGRLRTGISWNILASGFNQGSSFTINILMARLLGREIFGEYAIIQSTLVSVSLLAQVATGATATRYLAEFRSSDKERSGRILGLSSGLSFLMAAITALGLIFSAPWIAGHAFRAPHLSLGLMIGSGFLLFSVINGYQIGALAGLEGYRALSVGGIISGCLSPMLCGIAAWHWGLNGAIGGLAAGSLISCLLHNRLLKKVSATQAITATYRGLSQEHHILTKYAFPAALSGFLSMPAVWLANTFLVRQDGGYGQLALYSAAMNLRVLVMFLPRNINNVFFSVLNNQKGLGDARRYRKTYWLNIALISAVVIITGTVLLLLGSKLLRLYGENFGEAYSVLVILLFSSLIEALAIAIYQIIQTKERIWASLFAIALPNYGSFVLLAYFLAPLYGANGLAWAFMIGWGLALLIISLLVWRFGLDFESKVSMV